MKLNAVLAATLASLLTTACASRPHVPLQAPGANAPAAERVKAYEDLHALGHADAVVVGEHGTVVAQSPDFLVLADGRRVYHADDLVPVVAPQSPTAQAAQRGRQHLRSARPWQIAGAVVLGIGLSMAIASSLSQSEPGDPGFRDNISYAGWGLGLAFVGAAVGALPTIYYGKQANDEKVSAFATYDKDLRSQLDVCSDGLKVVACGAPVEAPAAVTAAPVPAPDPAAAAPAPAPVAPAP